MNVIRQAIVTKYLGPTNHRGPRVVAKATAGRHVGAWRYDLGIEGNHMLAANALLLRLGWDEHSELVGGSLPDGSYVWVLIPKK